MSKFDPGGFRIHGDGSYEDAVEAQLTAILGNPVGKLLLELIDAHPKFIHIVPYTGGDCNAAAEAKNPADAAPDTQGGKLYVGNPDGAYVDAHAMARLHPMRLRDSGSPTRSHSSF